MGKNINSKKVILFLKRMAQLMNTKLKLSSESYEYELPFVLFTRVKLTTETY